MSKFVHKVLNLKNNPKSIMIKIILILCVFLCFYLLCMWLMLINSFSVEPVTDIDSQLPTQGLRYEARVARRPLEFFSVCVGA